MEVALVNPGSAAERAGLLVVQLRPGSMGTLTPASGGTTVQPVLSPVTRPVAVKPVISPEERALDKVKDALMDELKDLSMDLPTGYLEDKLAKASTPADRKRIENAMRLVQHLKESYALKDFSVWASYEDYSRDEIIEGAKMVAELTGIDEWIKNKLVKKWGLGRVIAFGEAAQDVVASAFDVTSEVLAWRRLNQLNRNSDSFLKAVEATSKRMKTVMEGIREREVKLGLPLGASKEACPQP